MVLQTADADMINPAYAAVHTTRLMNVLMLALAKLATRCPEVLPRVILSLSKVTVDSRVLWFFLLTSSFLQIIDQHQSCLSLKSEDKAVVLDRALLLFNTLKQPAVAATVLNTAPLLLGDRSPPSRMIQFVISIRLKARAAPSPC